VARVHGLQHVERFITAHLADDNAVGPHTQRVDDQLALSDRALAFNVGRPRFQTDHMPLTQEQFGRVFDGDDAFVFGDETREHVQ
jgi:hypothetical protein